MDLRSFCGHSPACPPAADGGAAPGGYADYQGELLLLDGPRGLVEALEQGQDVTLGTLFRTCKEMRTLLQAWLPPRGLLPWYHLFESYRQGGLDSVLTEALFHALSRKDAALHPTPYTLRPTPCTLHPAPYTLHPTPCNLHPTPYTPHPTLYTLHPTPYTLHPTP